jgi:hypothetical protein
MSDLYLIGFYVNVGYHISDSLSIPHFFREIVGKIF